MRNKFLLPFFLSCLMAPFAANAINIGGTIASNTTLTLANSPYIVTSTLTVNAGVTLTVPAGIEMRFNAGIAFNINGTLTATSAIFTSNDVSPVFGSWSNITFGNGSATLTSSTITGCTFTWGAGIYVSNNYTLNLTGSTVTRFSGSPLYLSSGSIANLNNTTFASCSQGININGGTANFSNNSLINNINAAYPGITLSGGNLTLGSTNITNCIHPITLNSATSFTITGTTDLLTNTRPTIKVPWSNLASGSFNFPAANVPYYFQSGFTVSTGATMSVADNNVLKFQNGQGLFVDGTLIANASVGKNIYFTSVIDDNWGGDTNEDASATAPARNNWPGIQFRNSSVDTSCVLRRAKIRYASIGVETDNASPRIDACEFSLNTHGLSMLKASNPIITSNSFASSFITPVAMALDANPTFTSNSFSSSDNQYDAIGLYGSTLTANGTIKVRDFTSIPNVTYVMLGSSIVPAGITLTIEAGVVIKSVQGSNYNIQVSGTIIANGTLVNPIVFTSVRDDNYGNPFDTNKDGTGTSPAIGDFGSISMLPGSTGSSFIYCKIRYAGGINGYNQSQFDGASLNFINSPGTVQNCEIKDVKDGINCFYGSTPTIQDNQFTNLGFAVTLSAAANPTLIGNTLTNVANRALGLIGVGINSSTELAVSGTIRQKSFAGFTNITYVLRNYILIANGTNVNIEAGVVIKNTYYGFTVNGGFKVDGTLANPVIFSSIKDDNVGNPGDTNGDGNGSSAAVGEGPGIYFAPTSNDTFCKLVYLKSYYGGSGYTKPYLNPTTGVIGIESANPVIDQVLLSNLSTTIEGIGVYGNAAPVISNTVFQNGFYFPVSMSILSNPVFSNITFTSMGFSAILINDDNITSNATLVTRSLAGISNIAYVLNKNLTVNSGATLTISPNVVIKFRQSSYYGIYVNGALKVAGTASNKVIFTDIADDSAGGDTNNNGNATAPTSSWYGITFENPSVDSVNKIEYAEIRFAGISSGECVVFKNAGGTVNQVSIIFGNTGLGIYGTANPTFQNIALQNLNVPVRMDMFANPTFGTITANNIAVMGIHIPTSTYSQSGTFPARNFAGYTNITYVLEGQQTINGGTTITIPAGLTFKGEMYYIQSRFNVLGRLNVSGTVSNPVVFTSLADDSYGNPADIQTNGNLTTPIISNYYYGGFSAAINFGDIADDSSTINYAICRFTGAGISCTSASPTITNCIFSRNTYGILLSGISTPVVNNNNFLNLDKTPLLATILTYPSSALNNTIAGTTWKAIAILDETLSQDITLPKRNFGGFTNIPYLFTGFTVGTTATLTIAPGVVTKWQGGTLNVNKGLNALGGLRADSNIVFTSYRDDFYGGDMNSDSTASTPTNSDWYGINFNDVSLDPLCKISNAFIRYAYTGITATNASPDIQKTAFSNIYYDAVSASGSSNPTINFCDFYKVTNFGVNNVNQSFVINAENNWWGNNSGPTHTGNPTGTGSKVTNAVDYLPLRSSGPNVPIAGDVSQNGMVQAFDASRILQFLVSAISLTATQQSVGDVSGNNSLSALDASLIMQFSTGLINNFPSEAYNRPMDVTKAVFSIAKQSGLQGNSFAIPLTLSNVNRLFGSFAKITFDSTYLQLDTLAFENTGMTAAYNSPIAGTVLISMAGTIALNSNITIAYLHLTIKPTAPAGLAIPLIVEKYLGNEKDLTSAAKNGSVQVLGKIITGSTGLQNNLLLSPNPVVKDLTIIIENTLLSNAFTLSVTDMAGKKLIQKSMMRSVNNGEAMQINLTTNKLPSGVYILSVQSDKKLISKKFIVGR